MVVEMDKYATSEGTTFYKGLDKDPISAITSVLIYNLYTGNFELARADYHKLLATIRERGLQGKDIRYAARELNKLGRDARKSASYDVAKIAANYANQLPKPDDTPRRLNPKALRIIEGIEYQQKLARGNSLSLEALLQ